MISVKFVSPPPPQKKRFYEFGIGDVVVSAETQNVAIKTGVSSITFIKGTTCHSVDTNHEYYAPAKVEMVVTL